MMHQAPPPSDPDLLTAIARHAPGVPLRDIRRLTGGRTNHVWHLGPVVVKCHDPGKASPLFPNDPQAEAKALRLFAPQGLAPKLLAEGQGWLICDYVPPIPGGLTPASIAGLLYRLHNQTLPEDAFRRLPNGSQALLSHAQSFAPDDLPPYPADPQVPPVPPRPVHADAVLGNILSTPSGPTLIDWQCPGLGDPAEDLATLLSPAMMWLYTGAIHPAGWADALLGSYPDQQVADRTRHLLPVYRWRIMAHCAWKARQGDRDYATALQIERETD